MEGNVQDGNQQAMAERSEQLLLGVGMCGEAGEWAVVGLGVPQGVGWGPKEPAGTCIPLRAMVR